MEKTTMGASDLKVFLLGLGCMGMSEFYGAIDEEAQSIFESLSGGLQFHLYLPQQISPATWVSAWCNGIASGLDPLEVFVFQIHL